LCKLDEVATDRTLISAPCVRPCAPPCINAETAVSAEFSAITADPALLSGPKTSGDMVAVLMVPSSAPRGPQGRPQLDLRASRTRHAADVGRGRETHRHDYTRLPAALGDELGGVSTLLGLFASPPLILSADSVVVMVEGYEHGDCNARGFSRHDPQEMQGASAESALLGPMSSD